MKTVFHPTEQRGHADHGWLNAHHSFSFAGWYDPSRVHFGMLRVLNDDIVAGGQGFGLHPHNDMEIITIILEGALEHRDSMGNGSVIRPGDVQVMSAGSGVMHSEFNPSKTERTNLFQIWIFTKEDGIQPRYDQKSFDPAQRKNSFQLVASGLKKKDELYIHQNAAISLSQLDKNTAIEYQMQRAGNGAYFMVIDGSVTIDGKTLSRRDAIGVWDTAAVNIQANDSSNLIVIEVPMTDN